MTKTEVTEVHTWTQYNASNVHNVNWNVKKNKMRTARVLQFLKYVERLTATDFAASKFPLFCLPRTAYMMMMTMNVASGGPLCNFCLLFGFSNSEF